MTCLACICVLFFISSAHAAPKIQHWVTDNGVRVYFFPAHELPMLDLRVVFDAGAAKDGDKHGLALLTNGLMAEGAGQWDSTQIAERFEGVGAGFSNGAYRDMSLLSLRSLTDKKLLNTALETFKVVLNDPRFPKEAFEREKSRLLVSLARKKQSPAAIANEAFYRAVYKNHPYAFSADGEVETVKALTTDDLKAFYDQYFVAKNAIVALVGDVSRAQAESIVNRVTGDLTVGKAAAKTKSAAPLDQAEVISIDFPSSQTHILVGQQGMKRGDPDYFPLYIGNHILGGSGLVSVLADEIREKRGLAYSAYSYFIPMRAEGPFILGLQTKNESADEALTVLRETLSNFVEKGPTEAQLIAAKKNLVGGFALKIASNKKIVENLASIGFYGLRLDYLDKFIEKVEAVDIAQIKDAFRRRVHPDNMVTVIVGGKTK
ncbi:MAG TPA: insulinase family protein [Gammaproteobacteria bacterium]|nr:insulinase family protein [Gammaproteobacteria bacterium]